MISFVKIFVNKQTICFIISFVEKAQSYLPVLIKNYNTIKKIKKSFKKYS